MTSLASQITAPDNMSPSQLRKQTFRGGLWALIIIAITIVICAIFIGIGVSRSAASGRMLELVSYQQTVPKKLAAQIISLKSAEGEDAFSNILERLQVTVEEAKTVQNDITMPNKWGPMDAYEVEVLRKAYRAEPLMQDLRFEEMITAYETFIALAEKGHSIPTLDVTDALEKADVFRSNQAKMVEIYQDHVGQVLRQSGKRVFLTFLTTFLSLLGILVFLLIPFSKRIESQAKAIMHANDKLKKAALTDPLTILSNRKALTDHLEQKLEYAKTNKSKLAVAHIDLDRFKEVNDKYGHAAGDFMLVTIAKRMKDWQGASNFVARFGGDEFVTVMSCQANPCTFQNRIRTLLNSIAQPMNFEGITLQTTASIGMSIHHRTDYDSKETAADLIINADLALYRAKQNGRARHAVFEPHMRDTLEKRKVLESELEAALDKNEFQPYFQPQLDIKNNKVTGAEVLVRWIHKIHGPISPDEFLPVAESSGLMVRLGRQVMEKAIIEAAKWHAEGIQFGRLALNASASELAAEDFVDWLITTLKANQLPTHMLSIEILETVMFKNSRLNLTEKITRLRDQNIYIELDDFGTGYASLQQLKADEIDRIKLDRGFIKNIDSDHGSAMIVRAMIELAKNLDIDVIAEGAETSSELETLLSIGCETVQGYGVSKPMPAKIMHNWLNMFLPNLPVKCPLSSSLPQITTRPTRHYAQ